MEKYHISKDGKPGICNAKVKACPLGCHFRNIGDAQKYTDVKNEFEQLTKNKNFEDLNKQEQKQYKLCEETILKFEYDNRNVEKEYNTEYIKEFIVTEAVCKNLYKANKLIKMYDLLYAEIYHQNNALARTKDIDEQKQIKKYSQKLKKSIYNVRKTRAIMEQEEMKETREKERKVTKKIRPLLKKFKRLSSGMSAETPNFELTSENIIVNIPIQLIRHPQEGDLFGTVYRDYDGTLNTYDMGKDEIKEFKKKAKKTQGINKIPKGYEMFLGIGDKDAIAYISKKYKLNGNITDKKLEKLHKQISTDFNKM